MTADRAFWTPVVERVLRDVATSTDLDTTWRFQHRAEQFTSDPSVLELRLPRTWFELVDTRDVDEALLFLADRVQDHVVEELFGAWPTCAGHTHPMRPATSLVGPPVWRCPAEPDRAVEVGALGSVRAQAWTTWPR